MNNISVTIDRAQVTKYLKSRPENISKAITMVIKKATYLVERTAKIKSPVDTGRLRSSIFTEIHPMIAMVSTNTNYARYVHDGTRYISAQPFMRQASETVSQQMKDIVEQEVRNALQ
jgi:HK97 gp10 family phage protein